MRKYCLNRVKEEWKARLAPRTRARPATLRLSLRRCLGESNVVVGPENQTENHNTIDKKAEDDIFGLCLRLELRQIQKPIKTSLVKLKKTDSETE